MKKYLTYGLIALTITSCTDTDTDVIENVPQVAGHNLYKVTTQSTVYEFSNNKMIKQSDVGSSLSAQQYDYTYNAEGNLSAVVGTRSDGYIFFEREIIYDSKSRIIKKNDTYYNDIVTSVRTENVSFTYDEVNNIVTADYDSFDPFALDRVYYFNTNGLVSNVTYGTGNILLNYSGNDIVQWNNMHYTYDDTTVVKGEYLNMYRNMFNTYTNFVIYNGFPVPNTISTKYITAMDDDTGTGGDVNYTYEFDADGYPTVVHEFQVVNGGNSNDIFITYN